MPEETALDWARKHGTSHRFKSYVTRRVSDGYVYGTAYKYSLRSRQGTALLFVDGLRRFPRIEQGSILFIVGDAYLDNPPKLFQLASWSQEEGWVIAQEVTSSGGVQHSMPPHVTYYVTITN